MGTWSSHQVHKWDFVRHPIYKEGGCFTKLGGWVEAKKLWVIRQKRAGRKHTCSPDWGSGRAPRKGHLCHLQWGSKKPLVSGRCFHSTLSCKYCPSTMLGLLQASSRSIRQKLGSQRISLADPNLLLTWVLQHWKYLCRLHDVSSPYLAAFLG